MPLDFTNAHAPPTLGKKRTKEEIEETEARARRKKYDIKSGLRDQGGFTDSFRDWDRKKQKEYSSIIARQEQESTAQFGELPEGWMYFQSDEVDELLVAIEKNNFFDRNIQTTPRITGTYSNSEMTYHFTAKIGQFHVAMLVTNEELSRWSDPDPPVSGGAVKSYLHYSLNNLIYRLSREVRHGVDEGRALQG